MSTVSLNKNLHKAAKEKMDEFYTQLGDIENEMWHYRDQFRGKVIYCNCDDPYESNFFKHFAMSFNFLGLKKLIATSYIRSPIAGGQLPLVEIEGLKPDGKEPFKIEINEVKDMNNDGAVSLVDVELLLKQDANVATPLEGDGDFRSDECIELLKEADVVVTNPPFSLFREYVAQLIEHDKKFLIIGNKNALAYKEIFELIKENKLWLGYNNRGTRWFEVSEDYPEDYGSRNNSGIKTEDGVKYFGFWNVAWFTNLDPPDLHDRHKELMLYGKYEDERFEVYDNCDAIHIDDIFYIPEDYEGVMGVPISFIENYNPEQFEILRFQRGDDNKYLTIDGKRKYMRILIRKKKAEK